MRGNTMALISAALFGTMIATPPASGQARLDDLEMAHVAVVASQIDISYAHLALALSTNPSIRQFAETMIRDHEAVNGQVAALATRLKVTAKDNAMSRSLLDGAAKQTDKLTGLRGAAFDRAYIQNELAYHQTVNGAVANQFIPNIQNPEVKKAFQAALTIFRGHEKHAEELVKSVGMGMGMGMGMGSR
jgi:putative membrane protein